MTNVLHFVTVKYFCSSPFRLYYIKMTIHLLLTFTTYGHSTGVRSGNITTWIGNFKAKRPNLQNTLALLC